MMCARRYLVSIAESRCQRVDQLIIRECVGNFVCIEY